MGDTSRVGSYLAGASPYGALDMAGNVMEWTADWYDQDYYVSSPAENPQGPASGPGRVLRGGNFWSFWEMNRVAHREADTDAPFHVYMDGGFRCAAEWPVP